MVAVGPTETLVARRHAKSMDRSAVADASTPDT